MALMMVSIPFLHQTDGDEGLHYTGDGSSRTSVFALMTKVHSPRFYTQMDQHVVHMG